MAEKGKGKTVTCPHCGQEIDIADYFDIQAMLKDIGDRFDTLQADVEHNCDVILESVAGYFDKKDQQ